MALQMQFLRNAEGLRLETYCDGCGKPTQVKHTRVKNGHTGNLTIGYGHMLRPGEKFPNGISKEQAEAIFQADVGGAVQSIKKYAGHIRLNDNQMTALISFVFNLGAGPLNHGKTLGDCLRVGDYVGAARSLELYRHAHGQGVPCVDACEGLLIRRKKERKLFETPPVVAPPANGVKS